MCPGACLGRVWRVPHAHPLAGLLRRLCGLLVGRVGHINALGRGLARAMLVLHT